MEGGLRPALRKSADFVVFIRFTVKRIREDSVMLQFLLGLMAGGFFGVAIMCLMQMTRKHDDK